MHYSFILHDFRSCITFVCRKKRNVFPLTYRTGARSYNNVWYVLLLQLKSRDVVKSRLIHPGYVHNNEYIVECYLSTGVVCVFAVVQIRLRPSGIFRTENESDPPRLS